MAKACAGPWGPKPPGPGPAGPIDAPGPDGPGPEHKCPVKKCAAAAAEMKAVCGDGYAKIAAAVAAGRGLHSSTHQLNLSARRSNNP
jgi:hypothetical protein